MNQTQIRTAELASQQANAEVSLAPMLLLDYESLKNVAGGGPAGGWSSGAVATAGPAGGW